MLQAKLACVAGFTHEALAEDRAEESAEGEIDEADDAGGGTAQFGRVGFLDYCVGKHGRAGGDADDDPNARRE